MNLYLGAVDPSTLGIDTSQVSVNQNPTVSWDQLDAAVAQLPITNSSVSVLNESYATVANQPSMETWLSWGLLAVLGIFIVTGIKK